MSSVPLAIETRALTKRYGSVTALDGVDLAVPEGVVFGVIGPNGAGKTTTMRLLLDIVRPTSGSASVLGVDPRSGGPALRRQIGFLPGELRLDARITGRALLHHFESISGPVAPGTVASLADRLGLDLDRRVRSLSKGNKQKLGIVQAFMHRPRLLVLDEPTSGLDPIVQAEFLAMVKEASESGQSVFLSSHVLSEIQQAADSVAILRAGKVVTVNSVDELRLTANRTVRVGVSGASADEVRRELGGIPNLTGLTVDASGTLTRAAGVIEGDIDRFVKTLARLTVTELSVEEPDLEQSVLKLYGVEPEEASDEQ